MAGSTLLRNLHDLLMTGARKSWAPVAQTSVGRFATDIFLGARAVARDFQGENISLRAAALTYISVFSLVPLLTVGLALLQALHQEGFQRRMRSAVHLALAPGIREESSEFLDRFLNPAHSIAIGSVGFVALLFSSGSLLRHIDGAVNEVWGIRRQRPLLTRLSIYLLLLLLGPIFLAASFSGTSAVRALIVNAGFSIAPQIVLVTTGLIAVSSLTLLYYGTPYAKVAVRSALAGGLVSGLGWILAKQLYEGFAEQTFRYDALYGSLSALPLFFAWIYVSWLIVLCGARLSYAVEHAAFRDSLWAFGTHPRALELVAARVAVDATLAWMDGLPPPLPRHLAAHLRVPESFVHDAIERMEKAHLLESSRKGGVRPARDPSELTFADVAFAIHGVSISGGLETWNGPRAPGFELVEPLFQAADCATADVLRKTRWIDIATALRPPLAAPGPAESQAAAS
ncbi:YhjD/YihY/BrkB family envelope integrity protein [Stigmatella aurantiaca]|uniref:Ribonuclease BN n=1 Tax=Stigmatella aurantiaca (strain DW4/3-1) TaxID=378806 RepID=Q08NJ3_STIAD|nr:YhjD/YihY/BrkB family envelope integrity protein [Stigmatella aurantiaca]ADO74079.1 Ribonuclease BN [Stigmatella aurantiaca DW4/3-1]EAU62050.1 ribonuclease BN, putative [Stigmatella aurantiaca DW4/3-1]